MAANVHFDSRVDRYAHKLASFLKDYNVRIDADFIYLDARISEAKRSDIMTRLTEKQINFHFFYVRSQHPQFENQAFFDEDSQFSGMVPVSSARIIDLSYSRYSPKRASYLHVLKAPEFLGRIPESYPCLDFTEAFADFFLDRTGIMFIDERDAQDRKNYGHQELQDLILIDSEEPAVMQEVEEVDA